ncbi:MAG: TAT-variant-translocated molybdopterin oxidoreductase [Bacteroidota bacterium]
MKDHKDIWIGTDQLNAEPDYVARENEEFQSAPEVENPRLEASRRDFLKYLGFGMGAATIAACDIPVRNAIPYVSKPDAIVPGVASYYASTFVQGGDVIPVLVKTREGRPIKVEGNSLATPITGGGTSARAQAAVLSLYDTSRFDGPYRVAEGDISYSDKDRPDWAEIDAEIVRNLSSNSRIRILGHTETSCSTRRAVEEFKSAFPNAEHVQYDPVSVTALLKANEAMFGHYAIPQYRFDQADVIVGINCDFLGAWIDPVQFGRQYGITRKALSGKMSRFIQVEGHMSLTGSNADNRVLLKPSELGQAVVHLHYLLVGEGPEGQLPERAKEKLSVVAGQLRSAVGKALVVCGNNNLAEQLMVIRINQALQSYGHTIETNRWWTKRQGDDLALKALVEELEAGQVDALVVMNGANPAYDTPYAARIKAALSQVGLKISMAASPNETALLCDYIAPDSNWLESWSDANVADGIYSLIQPTITPIFAALGRPGTRQAGESFLRWSNSALLDAESDQPYLGFVKETWRESVFQQQSEFSNFDMFWDSALHDGILFIESAESSTEVEAAATTAVSIDFSRATQPLSGGQEITFYETVNIGNGVYADNPWLQEMPDPVLRTTWGNYLSIPISWDGGNSFDAYQGLNQEEYKGKADKVEISLGDTSLVTTTVRQFGQLADTFAIAVGYGRTVTGTAGRALADNIGTDVYPVLPIDEDGYVQYYAPVTVSGKVGEEKQFASVQYHHSMGLTTRDESGNMLYYNNRTGETIALDRELTAEEKEYMDPYHVDEQTVMTLGAGMQGGLTKRSIIYQGNLDELSDLEHEIQHNREHAQHLNDQTLYPFETYTKDIYSQGHWWAMHIDLSACFGCGACEVACVAENNVPVVGKYEVWRHHEMKWLRIDRYYYGDYENPKTVYQPMMCQHCDNAPCENVCPVAATPHSDEGLNQMTYNRCIGTRYCANNCPYKVRRFNWLDYTTADLFANNEPALGSEEGLTFGADNLTRMVLNPDVTVRSRGVIEKCSFCAQRLQAGKLTAKAEGRRLRDADVRPACQTACPGDAITFGDRNAQGEVSAAIENPLNYLVLEETNVQPSVFYAARVNNSVEELDVL